MDIIWYIIAATISVVLSLVLSYLIEKIYRNRQKSIRLDIANLEKDYDKLPEKIIMPDLELSNQDSASRLLNLTVKIETKLRAIAFSTTSYQERESVPDVVKFLSSEGYLDKLWEKSFRNLWDIRNRFVHGSVSEAEIKLGSTLAAYLLVSLEMIEKERGLRLKTSTFEIYKDRSGLYRWRLKAPNGEIVAVSESFTTKAACINSINLAKSALNKSEITEQIED